MNPNRYEQEFTQLITKLPSWVSVAVGIVSTVILGFSLLQQNFVVASLTFGIILWLSCLYIWIKRTEPLIMGGRGTPAFPKWRRLAMFGMILIPLITVGSGFYWLVDVQNDVKENPVTVANLDSTKEISDRALEPQILYELGLNYAELGQNEKAIEYLETSLGIARETDDKTLEAQILYELGRNYAELGQNEKAIEYLESSLRVVREIGDRASEAQIFYELGRNYAELGQNEKAIEYLESSLGFARETGDKELEELIKPLLLKLQSQ